MCVCVGRLRRMGILLYLSGYVNHAIMVLFKYTERKAHGAVI